jgi:hypothetical protein
MSFIRGSYSVTSASLIQAGIKAGVIASLHIAPEQNNAPAPDSAPAKL